MSWQKLDKLIRNAGGMLIRVGRHRYYDLDGERLTIHMGGNGNSREETTVLKKIQAALRKRGR